MKRFGKLIVGAACLLLPMPLSLTGFGDAAMAVPVAGASIAALAGLLLRMRS